MTVTQSPRPSFPFSQPSRRFDLLARRFRRWDTFALLAIGFIAAVSSSTNALGQTAAQRRAIQQQRQAQMEAQARQQAQARQVAQNSSIMPSDPELLKIHRDFLAKAEKLGMDYERKRDLGKAREVYESIVRLVPQYDAAKTGLSRVLKAQAISDRRIVTVTANRDWQDSGVTLTEGMPVRTEIDGTWTVVLESDASGIQIPAAMRRRFNNMNLGTLVGIIATTPKEIEDAKPFVIKHNNDFMAPTTGRLFMKMFDVDPTDNAGSIKVLVQSSFGR